MNNVGISCDFERVGMQRNPEDGEIEIVAYPTVGSQAKEGHILINPAVGVLISINGVAPEVVGVADSGHYTWEITNIAGQRVTLRYGGGTAGSIPKDSEVTLWVE